MAEYIERENAIAEIKKYALDAYDIDLYDSKQFAGNSRGEKHCEGLYEATEILEEVPATDVVKVVRCKDCKYCEVVYPYKEIGKEAIKGHYCKLYNSYKKQTDFCSYGELKECDR